MVPTFPDWQTPWLFPEFLPTANEQTKLWEGYVFTGVCLSRGGGHVWQGKMGGRGICMAEGVSLGGVGVAEEYGGVCSRGAMWPIP